MTGLPAVVYYLITQVGATPASLRVEVADATTGHVVVGATVELVDHSRRAFTDVTGRVVFHGLAPGPHHVAVRRFGYRPHALHALVGDRGLSIAVRLTPMPVTLAERRVESSPPMALRDLERPDSLHALDRALSGVALRNHPGLPEPDALLAAAGGHVGVRPESPGGLHIMGGTSDQLAYLVDGIPVFSPYHAGAVFGALNADALQEVALLVSPSASALADALGGALLVKTRLTGEQSTASGGVSTTHSRFTLDLPFRGRTGLLVSGRLLFPGVLAAKHEPSHIDADGSDAIVRLEFPLAGGTVRLLHVGFATAMSTSSAVQLSDTEPPPPRNDLGWSSQSVGMAWERRTGPWRLSGALWRASASSTGRWHADSVVQSLESSLGEVAARVQADLADPSGQWTLGTRWHERRSEFARAQARTVDLSPTILSSYIGRRQRVGARHDVSVGTVVARYEDRWRAGPFVDVRVNPAERITLSVSASRRHQFMQSLRNAESLVSNVFPVDVYVNAGAGLPVASSDQVMLAVQARPTAARSVTLRAWTRALRGIALPAVSGDELAARSTIPSGSGRSRGVSVDVSVATARIAAMASYGVQHVRYTSADTSWTPESGVRHAFDAGVRFYPGPAFSLNAAVSAIAGRRATPYAGAFEWEACNLRDRGCEFASGSLRRDGALGSLSLPDYLRIDVGVRRHWHVTFGNRDALLGVYATWANLLSRSNVLTMVRDPATGARSAVGMRPNAPLVIGLDWSF